MIKNINQGTPKNISNKNISNIERINCQELMCIMAKICLKIYFCFHGVIVNFVTISFLEKIFLFLCSGKSLGDIGPVEDIENLIDVART